METPTEFQEIYQQKKLPHKFILASIFLIVAVIILVFIFLLIVPPNTNGVIKVEVEPGMSVRDIAVLLEDNKVVRSDLALYAILTYFHDPTKVFAGTYVFSEGENVFAVADKLARNEIENELVRLTLPEGIRATDMAGRASAVLPEFDTDEYLARVNSLEGTLFPETYFLPATFTAEDLANLQLTTYEEKISPLRQYIETSNLIESEVIILASVIEREANDETSMKLVSSVLQNRIKEGMPLQADATIEYVLDKPLSALTPDDLKIDSPYNSYLNLGLPPTPIGNPGLTAIKAVLEPTESDYFYYLTDENGEFHYAKTYNEHLRNIELYLRS